MSSGEGDFLGSKERQGYRTGDWESVYSCCMSVTCMYPPPQRTHVACARPLRARKHTDKLTPTPPPTPTHTHTHTHGEGGGNGGVGQKQSNGNVLPFPISVFLPPIPYRPLLIAPSQSLSLSLT